MNQKIDRFDRIGVVGAGAWGTALALIAARAGREAILWARNSKIADDINRQHVNSVYLPEVKLPDTLRATGDLAELGGADALLLAPPAQGMRAVATRLSGELPAATPLVICAKGIEQNSLAMMHEILSEILPDNPVAVLSGPTFAAEAGRGLPTAVTLAVSNDEVGAAIGEQLVSAIGMPTFRPYLSTDIVGAEIGGAVKNVLAIACGIVSGRQLGENARAAIITRGMAEILRLGLAKGALQETMMGLSGMGDLVLTCGSNQSRNMSLGQALGEGQDLADILASRPTVAEGVFSASAVCDLAATLNVEMPICAAVNSIVNHDANVDDAIENLLNRPFRNE